MRVTPNRTRTIRYEAVPSDGAASFTFREFAWERFPFNWHYHPEVELTFIVRGRGIRFVGDSAEEFAEGDLCLLGANTPHCWASHRDAEPGVRSLVVHFRPEAWGEPFWQVPELRGLGRLLRDAGPGLEVSGAARSQVEQLFVLLQQQPAGSLERLATLLEMLHCIARSSEVRPLATAVWHPPGEAGASGKLGQILGYIHSHLGPDLTQHEVAKAVHLSPAAFSQFFRRNLGLSYVRYVNELKIRNASRALLETDQPVTEIAYRAGFNNLSHFNAQFRRLRQLSPRAFRRQAHAAERPARLTVPPLTAPAAPPVATLGQRDVTLHGRGTRFEGVRVGHEEPRPWLRSYPACPALGRHGIVHAGIAEAHDPYRIVRTHQSSSYFLACFAGRGRVLVDGRWRDIRPGLACLLPEHVYNAFEALAGEPWCFAYVCLRRSPDAPPLFTASVPIVKEFDPTPVRLAIQGLTAACRGSALPAQVDRWVDLVQGYLEAFACPHPETSLCRDLWQRVTARLAGAWTPESLAQAAGCSSTDFRRMCLQQMGRTPSEHLTFLRMRQATELLTTTGLAVGAVARSVGYADTLRFSQEFRSHVGCRPTDYRRRARCTGGESERGGSGRGV